MGIFWIWRQIYQIGLLGAPRYSRHVLFSTLLGACWGVNVVFTIKIGREMAIFQARMKKSNWCLCHFRLFFFQLTFTGGNPWPNLVPKIPFGRKSGVFFLPANWKSSLFFDIVQLYLHRIFLFFGSSFHKSFKFFGQNGLQAYKGTTSRMLLLRCCLFCFFVVYHEMCRALYIWNFQNDPSFKKIWLWTSKRTFKIVWCYHCFNSLTGYSGACHYRNCQNSDYFTH